MRRKKIASNSPTQRQPFQSEAFLFRFVSLASTSPVQCPKGVKRQDIFSFWFFSARLLKTLCGSHYSSLAQHAAGLQQGLANVSHKRPDSKYFFLAVHRGSVATSQPCCSPMKVTTDNMQMSVDVFQYNFIYKHDAQVQIASPALDTPPSTAVPS